ncbi:MAG: hypothetical protein CVV44_16615 [Spirochaetae bacterium HGW-Spirochaetae-1]|nr:MAG: hypothetical protein CVV44_16615 [Spirochaetae bacterium HGW-Spirochaetae-1]
MIFENIYIPRKINIYRSKNLKAESTRMCSPPGMRLRMAHDVPPQAAQSELPDTVCLSHRQRLRERDQHDVGSAGVGTDAVSRPGVVQEGRRVAPLLESPRPTRASPHRQRDPAAILTPFRHVGTLNHPAGDSGQYTSLSRYKKKRPIGPPSSYL